MSKSFLLIDHINYQMTIILSREISSGLSPMSCVQTLQTCLAATCLLVSCGVLSQARISHLVLENWWEFSSSRSLTCGASLFFFHNNGNPEEKEDVDVIPELVEIVDSAPVKEEKIAVAEVKKEVTEKIKRPWQKKTTKGKKKNIF